MHKRSVALFQTSSNQWPRLRSTVTANRPWRTRSNARQQAKMASTHSVMATSGCADRYSLSSESQSIQKSLGRRMVVNQIDTEGGSGQTVNATVVEFLVCEQFKKHESDKHGRNLPIIKNEELEVRALSHVESWLACRWLACRPCGRLWFVNSWSSFLRRLPKIPLNGFYLLGKTLSSSSACYDAKSECFDPFLSIVRYFCRGIYKWLQC